MRWVAGLFLVGAACGPSIEAIDWVAASDAFGHERWVLVYRDLPD